MLFDDAFGTHIEDKLHARLLLSASCLYVRTSYSFMSQCIAVGSSDASIVF